MLMRTRTKRGDTLIEVLLATAIFSIIAVSSVGIMNHGLSKTQAALETTMARTEIDTQAEALRYIHDAYATDRTANTLWEAVVDKSLAYDATGIEQLKADIADCSKFYNDTLPDIDEFTFVIDTKNLTALDSTGGSSAIKRNDGGSFVVAPITPRITYSSDTFFDKAEGLWVVSVMSSETAKDENGSDVPQYYDFYIQTCWNTPGSNTPTNLSTTIRLHNPLAIAKIEPGGGEPIIPALSYTISYVFDDTNSIAFKNERQGDMNSAIQVADKGGANECRWDDSNTELKCYYNTAGSPSTPTPNQVSGFVFEGWTESNDSTDIISNVGSGRDGQTLHAYWPANIKDIHAVLIYPRASRGIYNKLLDARLNVKRPTATDSKLFGAIKCYVRSWAGFDDDNSDLFCGDDYRNQKVYSAGGLVAKLLDKKDQDAEGLYQDFYEDEDIADGNNRVGGSNHRIVKLKIAGKKILGFIPTKHTDAFGSIMIIKQLGSYNNGEDFYYTVHDFRDLNFSGEEEVHLAITLANEDKIQYEINPDTSSTLSCWKVFGLRKGKDNGTKELVKTNEFSDNNASACAVSTPSNFTEKRSL